MSQSNTGQADVAETLTQETRTSIRQVRTRTHRRYAPEDKVRIVLEGSRREVSVTVAFAGGRGSSQASSMPGSRDPWKRGKSVSPGIR